MQNSNSTKTTENLNKVIKIDEAQIKNHLGEMVHSTVEDTLNDMLDAVNRGKRRSDEMVQTKRWFSVVLIGILSISGIVFAQTSESRYLLLDSRKIQSSSEVKLVLGPVKKHPDNPLYDKSDMPFVDESETFDNFYGNIIYEEGRDYPYRM